jgi:hypothetical protein
MPHQRRRKLVVGSSGPIDADRVKIPVNGVDPKSVRDYLAGLELAGAFEVEELRRTPMELKLRQIWTLMTSADLLEDDAAREAGVTEVRDRWRRIRQAFA